MRHLLTATLELSIMMSWGPILWKSQITSILFEETDRKYSQKEGEFISIRKLGIFDSYCLSYSSWLLDSIFQLNLTPNSRIYIYISIVIVSEDNLEQSKLSKIIKFSSQLREFHTFQQAGWYVTGKWYLAIYSISCAIVIILFTLMSAAVIFSLKTLYKMSIKTI